MPDGACGFAQRKGSAAGALERESEPGGGQIRQKKNQIRAGPQDDEPDAPAAKSADHAPCARNSSPAFTVPGLACRSIAALSPRRPASSCSSTSHAIKGLNDAPSSCTPTPPPPA